MTVTAMSVATLAVQSVDFSTLAPIAILTGTLLLLLLAWVAAPRRSRVHDLVLVCGLVAAGVAVVTVGSGQTFCTSLGCSYQVGGFTVGLQLITIVAAAVCGLLLHDHTARERAQWWALLLAATLGALVLIGARDLFTLLVALETASLPVVGLVALARDEEAATAATRLLLVSVGSFGFSLLGAAFIYAGSGTVYLTGVQNGVLASGGSPGLVIVGALLFTCGVGYKVALLPFGLWAADVIPAAPVPIAAFLSTTSKVAGVSAVALVLGLAVPAGGGWWFGAALAVAMTVANAAALVQRTALGLLAWSTMAQAAWPLLPVAAAADQLSGTARVSILGAAAGYLVAYVVASLTAFAVVSLITQHHPAGRRFTLEDSNGLIRREPVATVLLILALLTLAGIPPGVGGLIAKIIALKPVLDGGLLWLAVIAAVNIAIALAYYLRWIWALVSPTSSQTPLTWRVSVAQGAALSLSGAVLIVLTIFPGLLV